MRERASRIFIPWRPRCHTAGYTSDIVSGRLRCAQRSLLAFALRAWRSAHGALDRPGVRAWRSARPARAPPGDSRLPVAQLCRTHIRTAPPTPRQGTHGPSDPDTVPSVQAAGHRCRARMPGLATWAGSPPEQAGQAAGRSSCHSIGVRRSFVRKTAALPYQQPPQNLFLPDKTRTRSGPRRTIMNVIGVLRGSAVQDRTHPSASACAASRYSTGAAWQLRRICSAPASLQTDGDRT